MTTSILLLASFFLVWLIIAIVAPWKFKSNRQKANHMSAPHIFSIANSKQNCQLEYRLREQDQTVSEWKSVPGASRPRTLSGISYFPEKRERRPISNSGRVVKMLRQYGYRKGAQADPYWYLVNYLQQGDDIAMANALQFRIVAKKTYGEDSKGELLFISDWHIQ